MRPRQWTKNLALFVGLVFAQRLFTLSSFERAALAFAAFCLASSFTYLLNDLLDLENDRQHPTKRKRPLASGSLPISWAVTTMGILLVGCIALTLLIFLVPIEPQQNLFASLGGATAGLLLVSHHASPSQVAALQQTFTNGFHAAFITSAAIAAIGILTSLVRGKEKA